MFLEHSKFSWYRTTVDKTVYLPQALLAVENSSPALKGLQCVDILQKSTALK